MQQISVILADAHFLVRVGLQHLLEKTADIKVVGAANSEAELIERLSDVPADVVILDYDQPHFFSHQTVHLIKEQFPSTGILVISADNEKGSIYEVLEAGVTCFITKSCNENEILQGIRASAKKQRFFCQKVIDYVFERSFAKDTVESDPLPLTNREIEILKLVASGLIAKEIADKLKLSTHTIYTHRKNIMRKLKIGTSTELVLYAVKNGLVE